MASMSGILSALPSFFALPPCGPFRYPLPAESVGLGGLVTGWKSLAAD